jgi:hypothetical protein
LLEQPGLKPIRAQEEIMGTFGGTWETHWSFAQTEFVGKSKLYLYNMPSRFDGHPDVGIVQGHYANDSIGPWGSFYGTLSSDGRNWKGRWWGHPWRNPAHPNDWWFGGPSTPFPLDDISGEFWFQLSTDGNTFIGAYNNLNDPTRRLYAWDGYKVCEEETTCTKPLPNKDFPRKHPAVVKLPSGF